MNWGFQYIDKNNNDKAKYKYHGWCIHSMLIESCFHSVVTAEKILIVFLFSNINQNVQKAKMKDALHIC